jgi:hypothetical protein
MTKARASLRDDPEMVVLFRRTGERRYEIEVKRRDFANLRMSPAPGYDPLVPHDLLHMVVEAQLGLDGGVFGQLAAGGHAGTFHATEKTTAAAARGKNGMKKRGDKLLRAGRDDSAQSERATYVCWYEWRRRSQSPGERGAARAMAEQSRHIRAGLPPAEARALDESRLTQISAHLDELSAAWSRLSIGAAIAVRWPDLALLEVG